MTGIPSKRRSVFKRDRGVCWLCGFDVAWNNPAKGKRATVNHVVPRSLGGSDSLDNLRLAHGDCSHARGRCDVPERLHRAWELRVRLGPDAVRGQNLVTGLMPEDWKRVANERAVVNLRRNVTAISRERDDARRQLKDAQSIIQYLEAQLAVHRASRSES